MLPLRSPVLLAAAVLALSASATAQPQEAGPPRGAGAAERGLLLDLSGREATVRYSPGSLERAARVQESYALLAAKVAPWMKRKEALLVYLLSRDDWQAAGLALPYGFFARMPVDALALPAWGDPGTVELWRGLLGSALPEAEGEPVRGSPEEAASVRMADLLADVEAARLLLERAGIRADRVWAGELMAHAVAYSFLWKHRPARLSAAEGLYATILARDRALPAPALSDYRTGLSIEAWLRFQARFSRGSRRLAEAEGMGAGKAIVKLARRNGQLTEAALLKRWPALSGWLAESFSGRE